jgi:hypothetical protein
MKFNVGDIIRSKYDMIIDNIDEEQEEVKKGQYFIILSYGSRSESYRDIGFKILSQMSRSVSFWEIEEAPLEGNFIKE